MATTSEVFAVAATTITITLASLTNNSGRESTAVDNTTNLVLDASLRLKIKMGTNAPSGDMYVLLTQSIDGTNYSTPATGSDAALTPTQLDKLGSTLPGQYLQGTGLMMITKIPTLGLAAAATIEFPVDNIFENICGGFAPQKWGIVVINMTGQTLDATGGNFAVQYIGIKTTTT